MKRNKSLLTDSLVVLSLTCALIWPLFRLKYLDIWSSIESTFISDARMLAEHLPHPGWQPLWYCGTRFDYVYPPALRYGTALLSVLFHMTTARAYHLYTAVMYVFGILAVYWLVRAGSRSRVTALLSAAGTALLSPSFLLMSRYRIDSGFWIPQRLHVLMGYGEGPHISALCVLPAVLTASWFALRRWNPAALAMAAGLAALTVATNFYGATALAFFFPVLVFAVWNGERDGRVWPRAAGIAGLAYGLSAFWLTPSYAAITLTDLRWVAEPGNSWSAPLLFGVMAVWCYVSHRLAGGRAERSWSVFVAGAALLMSVSVMGAEFIGFRFAGNTVRLLPELDLALLLGFFEVARVAWTRGNRVGRGVVIALTVALFSPAVVYLQYVWLPFPKAQAVESQYEYKIARWTRENLPGARVLPSGSARFWFDTWADNAQPDGGSMQGMLNQNIPGALYQLQKGTEAEPSILWLQALGTDAVIVPDKQAPDSYHDYDHPEKFRGATPVLFDDGHGTVIYRIPRVQPGIGRVVPKQAILAARKLEGGADTAGLKKYVELVENPAQPPTDVKWKGFDEMDITSRARAGEAVLIQETYDPAWHARAGGKDVEIRPDPVMGFMVVDAPAGGETIRMRFETPFENVVGRGLFLVSLTAIAGLLLARRR